MKTLTMTKVAKETKTLWNGGNEGELCRVASSGDFLVGMDSAKAGTVVKVSDTKLTEAETIDFYKSYFIREWHLEEADALESAREDVRLMSSLASHFDVGDNLLVKITKSGRISVRTI